MDVIEAGRLQRRAAHSGTSLGAAPPGFAPGSLTAGPVADVIGSMERLICGLHAVTSRPVAEGLALAGKRAASLPDVGLDTLPHAAGSAAACVYHWVARPGAATPPAEAVLLAASSAQQAVDHCVAAHQIAERTGRPVVSLLDPGLADRIEFARLPQQSVIDALLPPDLAPAPEADDVLSVAAEALSTLSAQTGRSCAPVETFGDDRASYAIVALGADAGDARRLADRLARAGHPACVVAPALLRPLPAAKLAAVLSGRSTVFVLHSTSSFPDPASVVREALAGSDTTAPPCVPIEPGSDTDRLRAMLGHLGAGDTGAADDDYADDHVECRLGVLPGGEWGQRFLLHTAAQISRVASIQVAGSLEKQSTVLSIAISNGRRPPRAAGALDVLIAADLPVLALSEGLSALRPGGTLILQAPSDSREELWQSLPAAIRHRIADARAVVRWVDAAKAAPGGDASDQTLTLVLEGALLGPKSPLPMLSAFDDPVTVLIERLRAEEHPYLRRYSECLRAGASSVHALDVGGLEEARRRNARPSGDASDGLRMPTAGGALEWDLTQELKRFHAHGDASGLDASTSPFEFIHVSAALSPFFEPAARWAAFPLYLPVFDGRAGGARSLLDLLQQAVVGTEEHSAEGHYLRDHLLTFVRDAAAELGGREKAAQFSEVLVATRDRFLSGLKTSESGREAMKKQLLALEANLPSDGMMLGLSGQTLLELYTVMLQQQRAAAIVAFEREARRTLARVEDLLRVDELHDPNRKTADALASSLGKAASSLLDPDALARGLPSYRGGKRMDAPRRQRLESMIGELKAFLGRPHRSVAYYLVQAPGRFDRTTSGPCVVVEHAEPFAAAIGLFDGLLDDMLPVFRAMRGAKLELAARYRPEIHDEALAHLDGPSLTADEMKVVPSVLVWEEASRLHGTVYASFSQWAQSGRPLQAVVVHRSHEDAGAEAGLGYRAVAHRDMFVLQSSLANAPHLANGLARMMGAAEPAVAFVSVHESPDDHFLSWLQAVAEHQSRAHPTFIYDVAGGETWADRFDLSDNDQPDQPWAVSTVAVRDGEQGARNLATLFTYAEFAALNPEWRHDVRVIPPDAWNDDQQVPLADYLMLSPPEAVRAVPYVWVIDRKDTVQRAALTWRLAEACRERARMWKVLQELAGINNEYARRAGEQARQEDEQRFAAARQDLEAAHAAEVEHVRESAAEQTIERLVAVLMDMDNLPATDPALAAARRVAVPAIAPAPAPEEPAAEETAAAPAVETEEEDVSFGDPYIDAILCTSCDDCIKLNPRMFKYNDEKQAYIADAAAGTFAELVKAAESCPGKCIHPGAPRPGDDTVTDELLARAAAL